MTHLYTIDYARITRYLRKYDPITQYLCLHPYNDTSRPLIVPQEYLIHFHDFLLPRNISTQSVTPLTVINTLFRLHSMIKTNHIIPFLLNNHIPTTKCALFLPKSVHI